MTDGEVDSRTVFDSIDTGLILLDADQRVLQWNSAFSAMCGLRADVALGRRLDDVFPDGEPERLRYAIGAALKSGVSSLLTHSLHSRVFPLRTRAGRTLVHDVTVSAIGSKSRSCLIQIIDVTVAAGREHVLRERQNARYDAVVASAADVIVTFDAKGVIQLANPAARRQFGYGEGELLGKNIDILFPGEDAWTRTRCAVLNDRAVRQPVQLMGRRKDGSPSHLELSLSRWQSEKRIFVTAILRDVNERHAAEEERRIAAESLAEANATLEQRVAERTSQLMQAEEALRQSAKMEAIGQLTGGIAHDFNNLLQGVIGALDLVQRRIAAGRIGDVDRFLDGAMASAKRAAALTHRLLAFSRRQPVDPRPVDMNELIAAVEDLLRRSIGESIAMEVVRDRDLWLVRCDGHQLENALLNLSINARDALPDGGTLTIETSNATLGAEEAKLWELPAGEYVSLRVRDTGVGMPPDVKARAFDPFYTTKPIGQGTGLGLSTIYGFVRQSDGSIRIDSEEGKGTTVQLLLPRYYGQKEISVATDRTSDDQEEGTNDVILVVEDDAIVRLLIVDVLNDLGYRTLEAVDGPSALRLLLSPQRIDLLVTDIGLPGLNGRQLADAALEKRPGLRVLFMTGYAENAASSSFLASGMEIVAKPVTMDILARRIREIMKR
ncbi:MAG TPA: PAS domain S-box protein [Roseiarcus sp.]|jgi:PAS domain S-box-containing protein